MAKMHIKKGDIVTVISGSSKYRKLADGTEIGVKKGEVIATSPEEGKVLVKDANIIHKHVKPRREGQAGGIIKGESPLYASKVMLVCPKCGVATRVGHALDKNGNKVRVCKQPKCGHQF